MPTENKSDKGQQTKGGNHGLLMTVYHTNNHLPLVLFLSCRNNHLQVTQTQNIYKTDAGTLYEP